MDTVQKVQLNNDLEIPSVGLGTWKSKAGEVENAVKVAIDVGYRHIDCASCYGNEKEVGNALKAILSEGKLQRKDIFVTSKLWNTKHNPKDVKAACLQSMKDLQLDYLDLYLIHWPLSFKDGDDKFPKDDNGDIIYANHHPCDTWKAMEELVGEGLVKSIGLSNFNSQQVDEICAKAVIKPVTNQVECHPYLNQLSLIDHCKKHGIIVTGFSPLGSLDRPWAKPHDPNVMEDETIKSLQAKYNKSIAQICIRFQVQRGVIVIPKSVTPDRIKSNYEVFDFELTDDDMKKLEKLNMPWRACLPSVERDGKVVPRDGGHPHFPFHIPY